MPRKKHRGVSPWAPRRPEDIPDWTVLDSLPDVRTIAPEPAVEEAQRGYRALACAVVTQAITDLSRMAAEDLDAALEALGRLSTCEVWGVWLAVLQMDADVICEAVARRLQAGERIALPRFYLMGDGESAAAD